MQTIFTSDPKKIATVKAAAKTIRSINNKTRHEILNIISEQGEVTVSEIFIRLRMEQSVVSQHLAIMRKSKVVNVRRDGKWIYYSVNTAVLNHIIKVSEALTIN